MGPPSTLVKGELMITDATFISSTKLTCLSPDNSSAVSFGSGPPCDFSISETNMCTVRVFITNDGVTWSAYPFDPYSGTYETFTWKHHEPSGTFQIFNTTGPYVGSTLITITNTIASGALSGEFLESSYLKCAWVEAGLNSNAGFVTADAVYHGFIDKDNLVTMITCVTPLIAVGEAATARVYVTNGEATHRSVPTQMPQKWVDTGIDFVYTNALQSTNFTVTSNQDSYPYYARGPLRGNTEVTLTGASFVPTDLASCVFIDFQSACDHGASDAICSADENDFGWQCCSSSDFSFYSLDGKCCKKSRARYISPTEYRCMTPPHRGVTGSDARYTPPNPYTIRPGFVAEVRFAMDDTEVKFSAAEPTIGTGADQFFPTTQGPSFVYTDLYVRVDGSDAYGAGTLLSPFKTIQKAIDMALYPQLDGTKWERGPFGLMYGQAGAKGDQRMFNRDTVVLLEGIYRGAGNRGLRPRGKLIDIQAKNSFGMYEFNTVVDCENSGDGFMIQRGQQFWDNDDNSDKEAIVTSGFTKYRCENLRTFTAYNPFTKKNVPYHDPIRSVTASAAFVEPRVFTKRSGRSQPGSHGVILPAGY